MRHHFKTGRMTASQLHRIQHREIHEKVVLQGRIVTQKLHHLTPDAALDHHHLIAVRHGVFPNGPCIARLKFLQRCRSLSHHALPLPLLPLQGATLPGINQPDGKHT